MSLSEYVFEAMSRFPQWLERLDALEISGWTVGGILLLAMLGLIFATREFLAWFLKTNSIIDEVLRLETLVRDLQGDLAMLEVKIEKLQEPGPTKISPPLAVPIAPLTTPPEPTKFPLNH